MPWLQGLSVLIVAASKFLMECCDKAEVLHSSFVLLIFIVRFIMESLSEKSLFDLLK